MQGLGGPPGREIPTAGPPPRQWQGSAVAADPGTRSEPPAPSRDKTQATISFGERPQNGGRPGPGDPRSCACARAAGRSRRSSPPATGWGMTRRRACRCSLASMPLSASTLSPSYLLSPTIGMADQRHVRAQLMLAAGDRLERHPCGLVGDAIDNRIVRRGVHGLVLLAGRALRTRSPSGPAALTSAASTLPCGGLRHALHQRPVGLGCRARLEDAAELGRRLAMLGDQQHAGGIAVEPVHQPRPVAEAIGHAGEQAVDMAFGTGAALHGDAERLVRERARARPRIGSSAR